jgi:ABC-type dipeptide/oligopeptide/nickel transport system permease component
MLLGVFLASVLMLVFNLITDLLYAWIDPRVEMT